jgi:hypothetical protein
MPTVDGATKVKAVMEAARATVSDEVEVHHYQMMGVVTVELSRLQDRLGKLLCSRYSWTGWQGKAYCADDGRRGRDPSRVAVRASWLVIDHGRVNLRAAVGVR